MAFAAHLMLPLADRLRPVSRRGQSDRAAGQHGSGGEPAQEQRLRGVIGYHNAFKDPSSADAPDDGPPPSYQASRPLPRRHSYDDMRRACASLPEYNCSVFTQARLDMKIERRSPFDVVEDPRWEHVYAILQGTVLHIHAVKSINPLSVAANPAQPSHRAGKLLRSYTLQHAEAGLAADHHKYELVPKSHLVYLLSASAQRHLQLTEPTKFDRVYQHVIRLRLENHQLLLRFPSSGDRTYWMNKLSAAIDIAPPLEVRAEPKNITLPRRRRRRPNQGGDGLGLDALRDQQARIIREHYPQLAQDLQEDQGEPDNVQDVDDGRHPDAAGPEGAEREGEHDDDFSRPLSIVHQVHRILDAHPGPTERRLRLRVTTSNSDGPALQRDEQPDLDEDGKWAPVIQRDAAQESRIRRRCMPSLLFNSKRASNIIIMQGKRVQIDWDSRTTKPWPEAPPSYSSSHSDAESPPGSPVFQTVSQINAPVRRSGAPRSNRNSLLLRVRSTPERSRPDQSNSHQTNSQMDDVTSSDGSSHHNPAPKNFIARTANKIRRLTNRQQDRQSDALKREAASSPQDADRDAMTKLQAGMAALGSTTSLTATGTDEQRPGL